MPPVAWNESNERDGEREKRRSGERVEEEQHVRELEKGRVEGRKRDGDQKSRGKAMSLRWPGASHFLGLVLHWGSWLPTVDHLLLPMGHTRELRGSWATCYHSLGPSNLGTERKGSRWRWTPVRVSKFSFLKGLFKKKYYSQKNTFESSVLMKWMKSSSLYESRSKVRKKINNTVYIWNVYEKGILERW